MNGFTRAVVNSFRSRENRDYLARRLIDFDPGNSGLRVYVAQNMGMMIRHTIEEYEAEVINSEPLASITVGEQLAALNDQFVRHYGPRHNQRRFDGYIICDVGNADACATVAASPADALLDKWKLAAGRAQVTREDVQGGIGQESHHVRGVGAVICDQSGIGLNQHVDRLYNDPMVIALNSPRNNGPCAPPGGGANVRRDRALQQGQTVKLWGGAFGEGTDESNARLLSRRIFRKNEQGIVNGIPLRRQKLHSRHYERDIGETISGCERDCAIYRNDTSSLLRRIDRREKPCWI